MIDNIKFPLTDETRDAVLDEFRRINKANTVLVSDLSQYGQVNFQSEMLETYFEAMVEMGLIDHDQLLVIRLTWEQRFNKHLRTTTGEVKKQLEQQERLQRLGAQPKKPGLIVPGR